MFDVTNQFVSVETADTELDCIDIRLDRPEKLNALPKASVEALTTLFESIERDDGCAVVVRGNGAHFSVGADLADFDIDSDAKQEKLATTFIDLTTAVRTCPLPVVTAIQGRAMGAGFLLALAADFVIAASKATFAVSEVKLGIPVSGFATTYLADSVGDKVARDWLFTGRDVSAEEAADAGFTSRTVKPGEIDTVVSDVVETLHENSTDAIAQLKSRMAISDERELQRLRQEETNAMIQAFKNGDATERVDQFLQ